MVRTYWIVFILFFCGLFVAPASADDLHLTIVYDNNPYNENLETRWGFSCLVEGSEKTIIFDVGGEGSVLLKNMEKLNISPKAIDIVVLSHIHHDHIGGLPTFLRENPDVAVYMPRSFPKSVKGDVKRVGAELVEVGGPTRICKGVYSTGELGAWLKEESLLVRTSKGLVIVTGCAHPGIVNIVRRGKEILKADVYLALGGFHLCWMSSRRIRGIVNGMKREGVKKVAPCHCSGDPARDLFKDSYGKDFILIGVGKKITVRDAF